MNIYANDILKLAKLNLEFASYKASEVLKEILHNEKASLYLRKETAESILDRSGVIPASSQTTLMQGLTIVINKPDTPKTEGPIILDDNK